MDAVVGTCTQPGGTLECCGCDGVRAAVSRPDAERVQFAGGVLVRTQGRLPEVPRPAVDVVVGQGPGERAVHRAARTRRRIGVDGRTHQGVPKGDAVVLHPEQVGVLGLVQGPHVDVERRTGPCDQGQVTPTGRRHQQRRPR